MTTSNGGLGCRQICWIVAVVVGIIAAVVLAKPWGFFLALIAGILVCVLGGLVLVHFFCGEEPAQAAAPAPAPKAAAAPAPAAAPATAAPAAAAPAAETVSRTAVVEEPAVKPSKELPGEAELADQKGTYKYQGESSTGTAAAHAAAKAAAAEQPLIKPSKALKGEEELAAQKGSYKYVAPAAEKPKAAPKAAKAAAPKDEAKVKPSKALKGEEDLAAKKGDYKYEAPAAAAAGAGTQPVALASARGGQADDLKKIEGIGPKLEEVCNSLGIYHYDQIASWGEAEIAWMDSNLPRFKGRVSRDKWVAQAKLILEIGMEAFLERAKTNDY